MPPLSELEQFLRGQQLDGSYHSSGQFTLERDKALAKLAAYQLPRPHAWILKAVQCAVQDGASQILIRQLATETFITFPSNSHWDSEEIAREIFDPEPCAIPAIDSLKRCIWSASLQKQRPFRLVVPDGREALLWDGNQLHRQAVEPVCNLQLSISLGEKAAPEHAGVVQELQHAAFSCPVPLDLDGRRLDALQRCPKHGCTPGNYPLHIQFLKMAGPPLKFSLGTRNNFSRPEGANELTRHLTTLLSPIDSPHRSNLAVFVTAHVVKTWTSRGYVWNARANPSVAYWVQDGVVIQTEPLQVPPLTVSMALVLSAEGLDTDLSGFQLVESAEKKARLQEALTAAHPLLRQAHLNLDGFRRANAESETVSRTALGAASLGLTLIFPPALVLTGAGLLASKVASSAAQQASRALEADLRTLKIICIQV